MLASIQALVQKCGTQKHRKDSISQQPMLQELETTTLNIMIFQIQENMFYQSLKELEKENLTLNFEIHLYINLLNKQKVIIL